MSIYATRGVGVACGKEIFQVIDKQGITYMVSAFKIALSLLHPCLFLLYFPLLTRFLPILKQG
jgi:hypothetical protein